ncbi:MAG TPA: Na(+)/H(+) antiporter subunit B [Chitinophagaceae bacterium]|nr:Na(+)/H(+) antiporter subunit B [Chitinophagaceae bacterium]
MVKQNNLILKTTTSLIAFILLGFAIYLLFAGHDSPGGGFVGGLMTSAAIILLYMAYGLDLVEKIMPINFKVLIPIGLLLALLTGLGSLIFNLPFLTHTFISIPFPFIGSLEIATAMFFDLGVYITVLGATITIILTIAHDR